MKFRSALPGYYWNRLLNRFTVAMALLFLPAFVLAQQVTVDITPGHATNTFSPLRALGAGIDRDPLNSVKTLFDPSHVQTMLSAGWGPISYRLNTELSIQAWHWNPHGTWSDASGRGYFVGDPGGTSENRRSFGYNLPHRGTTYNYGTFGGYSRLDDGDASTYWKSNPYLDRSYTGDDNSLHPGWIIVDLGGKMKVNAIKLAWSHPYATKYKVQYWTGEAAIDDPGNGEWKTFPKGEVKNGKGGTVTLKLASGMVGAEFVRVLMTASSGTCDTHGSGDPRNCVGFAVGEVYLGYFDQGNQFVDLMSHRADEGQTATYGSSVDPWHERADIAEDDGEQPGFDVVFKSALTRGLPMTIPVAMLYDNPENAANEIAFLESRGYAINYVELGEEPDGQFVLPEDDAALYGQWADAIHKVDPKIKLAGPVFEGTNYDIPVWPDAKGNVSWFNRFLNYLGSHDHLGDLDVMTFEHYPFNPCHISWKDLYREPRLLRNIMQVWREDGLPESVPMQITESNLAYDTATDYMNIFGALWLADYAGSFLTAGGQALYYYQWEALPMYRGCGGWGTFGMFVVDGKYNVEEYSSQYFSAQILTQEWAQPVDASHDVYPASSDVKDGVGNKLVTAYAALRPDGRWSLLLVNKDQNNPHTVQVKFHDAAAGENHYFSGKVKQISFGSDDYVWHAMGKDGYADPDGPAERSDQPGGKGTEYTLPAASVTVLRGAVR